MSPLKFARVLSWSPEDEAIRANAVLDNGGHEREKYRPAPWPVIMLAQRLAWHGRTQEAFEAVRDLS